MALSIWQYKNPSWLWNTRANVLNPEWDDWDSFYIEWRNGAIQMMDSVLDASGDSLQAFDPRDELATRTERGIAYLERHAERTKAQHHKTYVRKGRRSHARGDTFIGRKGPRGPYGPHKPKKPHERETPAKNYYIKKRPVKNSDTILSQFLLDSTTSLEEE